MSFVCGLSFIGKVHEFTNSLVGLGRHEHKLDNDNAEGHNEVDKKKLAMAERAVGTVIDKAIEKENGTRRIKSASEQGENEARVTWESIGELERRDEGKWTTHGQEQIAQEEAIKGKVLGIGQNEGTGEKAEAANQATDAWAEMVENGTDRQGSDVSPNGGDGEHEIEVNLDACIIIWRVGAVVSIRTLIFKDGLDSSIAKDNAGSEQAVSYGCRDLN